MQDIELPQVIKKPDISEEKGELSLMSNSAQISYIKDRLAHIGSDLMNTRYERDTDVDAVITFLQDKQSELEDHK